MDKNDFEETLLIKGNLDDDNYDEYQHALQEIMQNFGLSVKYI